MIARDKIYIAALLCSILCSVVFIHYEAVLPQYLLSLDGNAAIKLITLILVTNACTVLVFQTFIVRFMAQMTLPRRILMGGAVFFLAQLSFFPYARRTWGSGCRLPACLAWGRRF